MILKGDANYYGVTIGVLGLESHFPKPPGHIKNQEGLGFPVLYETIHGASIDELIENPTLEYIQPFIDAAKRLEKEGVGAITGSCGFLALFQKELANAVNIPVFASSLIQVPLAYNMLGDNKVVGVLTANAAKLSDDHLKAVGADGIPVVVQGLEESTEFREVILEAKRNDMNMTLIEKEVMEAVHKLKEKAPNMGALVLECTDLPPFSAKIQKQLNIPIFDLTTLTTMIHEVVRRKPYSGTMQEV